jgi:hypothetical protein
MISSALVNATGFGGLPFFEFDRQSRPGGRPSRIMAGKASIPFFT